MLIQGVSWADRAIKSAAPSATAFAAGGLTHALAALGKPASRLMRAVCDSLADVPDTLRAALRGAAAVSNADWVPQWEVIDSVVTSPRLAGLLRQEADNLASWPADVRRIGWNSLHEVRRRAGVNQPG